MFGAAGRRTGNEEQNTTSQDLTRVFKKENTDATDLTRPSRKDTDATT
ncbi:hypothetical protein [Pollutimonas bauzanensis]|jgi:hypothetical protein